jgi:hypothetical protein
MTHRYDAQHEMAMEEDCKSRLRGLLSKLERRARHELGSLKEGLEGRVDQDTQAMVDDRVANVLDYFATLRKEISEVSG